MATNFKALWKAAKLKFEGVTGKKKPGEKFLGVFRKSSGIESAFESLDKSIVVFNKNLAELIVAYEAVKDAESLAISKYLEFKKGIESASKTEDDQDTFQTAIFKLSKDFGKITHESAMWIKENDPREKGFANSRV